MRRLHPRRIPPMTGPIGVALALLVATTAGAWESPSDATSVARYIPRDNVFYYVESQGLDAHAPAWKQSAAYKILNDTTTGAMLEQTVPQVFDALADRMSTEKPPLRVAELIPLVKHLARSGFVLAGVLDKEAPKKSPSILVVRNGFKDKEIAQVLAKVIRAHYAKDAKPQSVVRAGHKVISGVEEDRNSFAWWVDEQKKEDLIIVSPIEAADLVFETLEGKRPSFLTNPKRAELFKPDDRLQPTGCAFFNMPSTPQAKNFEKDYGYLGIGNIADVGLRWGFQDQAMVTLARIATSGPRTGLLAFIDSTATLDKAKLPPLPKDVGNLVVTSLDIAGALDRLRAQLKLLDPNGEAMADKLVAKVKEKTKLRLKEDLLAHFGPKVAWYTLPSKTAPATTPAILAPKFDLPRFAAVVDIDNSTVVGKVLDQAIAALNREFKTMGKPPGQEPAKGARTKAASGSSLEFRSNPGETKSYTLQVPQELAAGLPSTFRPTIRIGPKHLVVGSSPEVARAALEVKANWVPPAEIATAYQALPANLKMLVLSDPREVLPGLLAALPGKLQPLANLIVMTASTRPRQPGANGDRPQQADGFFDVPAAPPKPGANGNPPQPPAPIVLQVDAGKLPSADAIKALLFPSLFTVEATEDEVLFTWRDAFPSIGDPSALGVQAALILPAIQAARDAARRAAGSGPAKSPAPPAGATPGSPASGPTPAAAGRPKPKTASGNNPN